MGLGYQVTEWYAYAGFCGLQVSTLIGYGSPNKADTHDVHGAPLGKDETAATRENLKWNYGEFEVLMQPPSPAHYVLHTANPPGSALSLLPVKCPLMMRSMRYTGLVGHFRGSMEALQKQEDCNKQGGKV